MICWRHVYYTARKLLAAKCSRCYSDIDTGDVYRKWVGWCEGMGFYWSVTHERC